LDELVAFFRQATDMITVVASANDQQAGTSEEISRSIEGISGVTQETAAGLQQIARSSEDLNRLAQDLESLTQLFTISATTAHGGTSKETCSRMNSSRTSIDLEENESALLQEEASFN